MDYPRALTQIAEIHQQIAKGEIYRGYRPVPVAGSGIVGIVAACVEPFTAVQADPIAFLRYWAVVGVVAGLVGISEIAYNYLVHDDASGRRRTRQVVGQFLPAVAAAAAITFGLARASGELVPILPGIWAISFGLGTFASRPYLPRASSIVATFYLVVGAALLWTLNLDAPLNGWTVGGTFGAGQLLAAAVLSREVEPRRTRFGA